MMEGLDKIRESVLKRARGEADIILNEAKAEAEGIFVRAAEIADRLDRDQDAELSRRRAGSLTRATAMGQLESRRVLLEARQGLINETLELAQAKLAGLPENDRKQFYLRLLADVGANGQTITFSKQDEGVAEEIVRASGYDLTLAPFDDSFIGGFILREGRVRWRFTYADIMAADRDSYVELAAAILYPSKQDQDQTERETHDGESSFG